MKSKPPSPTAGKSRMLLWAGAACVAVGWGAEILAAALGRATAWPNWLILVAVTGLLASNLIRPARLRAGLVVAMAVLSVAAIIGFIVARL